MREGWTRDASVTILSTAATFGRMAGGAVNLMEPTERDIFVWGGDKRVMLKIGEVLASYDDDVSKELGRCARIAPKKAAARRTTERTG